MSVSLAFIILQKLLRQFIANYTNRFDRDARTRLDELFVFVEVGKIFPFLLLGAIFVALAIWAITERLAVAALVLLFFFILPRLAFNLAIRRRQQKFQKQLPAALVSLAGLLRAGMSLNLALTRLQTLVLAPLSQELALIIREQRLGTSIDDCLLHFYERMPIDSVKVFTSLLRIALSTGGSMSTMLDRHAMCLKHALHLESKAKVLSSQGRMQAWVMGLMPFALLFLLDIVAPELTIYFYETEPGHYVLAMIVLLEILGIVLIKRILHSSV